MTKAMKDLKITKGEWVGVDYAGHYSLQVSPVNAWDIHQYIKKQKLALESANEE